ncbi:MAG: hypothetical protein ACREM8_04905, partial [Vulcanimicrobiaceae bacterium]
ILAARFGVPFLAVPYDPKVSALCDELAYPLEPLFTPGERGRQSDPSSIVDRAWTERAVLAQHLRERLGPMQRLAGANFDALDRLVRLTR